jgi:hypothetical protein
VCCGTPGDDGGDDGAFGTDCLVPSRGSWVVNKSIRMQLVSWTKQSMGVGLAPLHSSSAS